MNVRQNPFDAPDKVGVIFNAPFGVDTAYNMHFGHACTYIAGRYGFNFFWGVFPAAFFSGFAGKRTKSALIDANVGRLNVKVAVVVGELSVEPFSYEGSQGSQISQVLGVVQEKRVFVGEGFSAGYFFPEVDFCWAEVG